MKLQGLSKLKLQMNAKKIAALLEISSKLSVVDLDLKKIEVGKIYVATIMKNIENLGFTFSDKLVQKLNKVSKDDLVSLYQQIVPILKKMKGANVRHKPMYPNFPDEVMNASEADLYMNAIAHYSGVLFEQIILPDSEKKTRFPLIGNYDLTVIDLASKTAYRDAIANLVSSSIALSETHKQYIEEYYEEAKTGRIKKIFDFDTIQNKEILAFVAGLLYKDGNVESLSVLFKTPTDVLRFIVSISEGDVSLAENTKFKKLKRSERRIILKVLDKMNRLSENMVKYKGQWIRLGEILHPGEFSKRFPNVYETFKALRENEKIETFNSMVEKLLLDKKFDVAADVLSERPTEMARRLDHLLRGAETMDKREAIVKTFRKASATVPTSVLLNIRSHFLHRHNMSKTRMFFPKGSVSKAKVIDNNLAHLPVELCGKVVSAIDFTLNKRFAELDKMGKVYIDPALESINVPFALRSASKSFKGLSRGSSVKIDGDKAVVRLFIYWKNGVSGNDGETIDVDLSSMFLNENFQDEGHVSFTRTRSGDYGFHSGDILNAPNGASEFIDIKIADALKTGVRYVAMNVLSFSGQSFDTMNEVFAGVMLRDNLNSGEIYEAKTVEHKYDLTSAARCNVPMIFDLKERKIIWLDLTLGAHGEWRNTVEGNKTSNTDVARGIMELKKPTLHELFTLHAKARGTIVNNVADADLVFDLKYAVNSLPEILDYL